MASEAQIAANRANAKRSTGPRTEEGKARAALNGLKHGMCAKVALLPGEEPEGYEALLADLTERWQPVGEQEAALVEDYAGCSWRLRRGFLMETGMLRACWPNKLQALADETADGVVLGMAMETVGLGVAFRRASKEIARLSLHESRLERRRERARKELEALQAQRRQAEAAARAEAEAGLASDSPPAEDTVAGAGQGTPRAVRGFAPHPEAERDQRLARELASDSQAGEPARLRASLAREAKIAA